jgi:hypothetical protein
MREHPIIFSGGMVRAILDGRKTQTRRVIQPQPPAEWNPKHKLESETGLQMDAEWRGGWSQDGDAETDVRYCPYGIPGDRLWVRETFALMCRQADPFCWCDTEEQRSQNHYYEYRADTGNPYPGQWDADDAKGNDEAPKWKPAIHMPRAASRIALEIVSVRVEQINDISAEDAEAEGITAFGKRGGFRELWDSINAKRGYSWESNPWVWVIAFKRVTQ